MASKSQSVPVWIIVTYAVVFILSLTGIALGIAWGDDVAASVGALGLLMGLATAPIAVLLATRGGNGGDADLRGLQDAIQSLSEQQALSEDARRVLNRREERELLRRAIEQDIQAHDYDAAMVLVKELAERFGYRADAEEFRERIEQTRAQTLDLKVVDAMAKLDELIRGARWAEAFAEAARIQRLYPESHRVEGLRERVDESRQRYRKHLERSFLVSAQREKIDEAMAILKELDQYLTPSEAEPFQEVARGVIGKSRENLGVRFKLMVQDHQWGDAVEVGERIIGEFPNTRMAQEVRELLPMLREKAAASAAGVR
ncbi:MAG: hypothetical protein EA380_02015 [Phycisphaeraceae bacterium]|nr:MAG: hypothetical protein EA380_02015 [Phycisphaeraceae bacterium]